MEFTTRKLGLMPLHTSTQIQFEWNEIHAIPPYIDYSEREHDNAIFGLRKWNGTLSFHCIMFVVEGNMTMPPFLLLKWNSFHSTIH